MYRPLRIGILGGGQLARMSAYAAYRMGFELAILDKDPNAPAFALTHNRFAGWVDDDELLKSFAAASDVITLENEFVDYHRLEFLERLGKRVIPGSAVIALIQDKLLQKQTLTAAGLPTARFLHVHDENDFDRLAETLGLPFLLKSRKMGYDGYGNAEVSTKEEFLEAHARLSDRHENLFAEEFIEFEMELAVSVVRTTSETRTYPVVQTIQREHICHTVIAPAEIDPLFRARAEQLGIDAVRAIDGFGIFAVELFLKKDGTILINELAPRAHNSCHYSIDGCVTSQFENHLRAVLNLPLGSTALTAEAVVMVNLLGRSNAPGILHEYHEALADPDVHLHLYGKEQSRVGRKMGHLTITGSDVSEIRNRITAIEQHITL